MKKYILFLIVILLVIISSCVGQKEENAAEATMKYLNALAEKDKTTLINLSCKSWEEQAALEVDALLSVAAELNDVTCSVSGQEGDFQLVNCSGGLDLTYGEEIRSIDLSLRTYYMAMEDGQWRVCSYK